MRQAHTSSLLDDPFFVAELERVEIQKGPTEQTFSYGRFPPDDGSANDDLREVVDDPGERVERAERVERVERAERPVVAADMPVARRPGYARVMLAVGGFLTMMLIGAAAAAAVWHDRLALILR